MSQEIEALIAVERWDEARAAVRAALRDEPSSHWLHARLALTFYEQRRYDEAYAVAEHARRLAPRCPLVLWEVAGALDMLDRTAEAVRVYRSLVRRGTESLAYGECGEGRAWRAGWSPIVAIASPDATKNRDGGNLALSAFEQHLSLRGPGCRSIYPIVDVRCKHRALLGC